MNAIHRLVEMCATTCLAAFAVGCTKQPDDASTGWTAPIRFTESEDSLGGHASLHKWHDTILAWQFQRNGTARRLIRNPESQSWSKQELNMLPLDTWDPIIDEGRERLLLYRVPEENDRITLELSSVGLAENAEIRINGIVKWTTEKKALFGNVPANVRMNDGSAGLGNGIVNGLEILIPYSINAETVTGKLFYWSHFNNGVFRSADAGNTWQLETISSFEAGASAICKTKYYLYYFALKYPLPGNGLWTSRRPLSDGSWEKPEMITTTFGHDYGNYAATATGDAVHVCWLDGRHEKTRLSMDPYRKNYEVAYAHRKDSDEGWSKEILLSKGLLFAYWPTMSVEGDKVVIAWAGIKTASGSHGEFAPNDIYYATSKDGGETWAKPMNLTNRAKDGIVSGRPQVVLLNGVIHLVYVQGMMRSKQESPGLTMLKQPPWPIYYQQRPFPK